MSVRLTKCPECGSTRLERVKPASEDISLLGNQEWELRCEYGHEFIGRILVKRRRGARY